MISYSKHNRNAEAYKRKKIEEGHGMTMPFKASNSIIFARPISVVYLSRNVLETYQIFAGLDTQRDKMSKFKFVNSKCFKCR